MKLQEEQKESQGITKRQPVIEFFFEDFPWKQLEGSIRKFFLIYDSNFNDELF